jgi:ubiquinone/menaquinone biosynthesis C-methylase UbiE
MNYNIETIYDNLADDYDAHFTDAVSMAENEAVFYWINTTLSGCVCDLGCGTGLMLEYLKIPTEQYVGVDISRRMLNHAQHKFPDHRFIHADIQGNVPLDDNRFNGVLAAFGVMSYCAEPHTIISEIKRLLQPGGRFFIMLCGEPYQHRATHILNECDGEAVYFKTYTPPEISKMFRGFAEIEISGFSPVGLNRNADISEDIMTQSITTDAVEMRDRYFLVVTGHA